MGQAQPGPETDVEQAPGDSLPHLPPTPGQETLGENRPAVVTGGVRIEHTADPLQS